MSIGLALAIVLHGVGVVPPDGDRPETAYAIVTATAIPVLPPQLGAFFKVQMDSPVTRSPDGTPAGSPTFMRAVKAESRCVFLDVAAQAGDAEARRAAALAFPRDRSRAAARYRQHGVTEGGWLPWALVDRCAQLAGAMRDGEAAIIIAEARMILELSTEAALPFNTTFDRSGSHSGNIRWAADSSNGAGRCDRTVRHRFHEGLPSRLRSRLSYEVRVAPERFEIADDPLAEIFAVLLDSYQLVARWSKVDEALTIELGVADTSGFAASSDAYYDDLARREVTALESRLEAASLLGARLIGSAWVKAGRPDPRRWASSATDSASNRRSVGFVGSRHSTIYHTGGCGHAKRIKPDNLVAFASVAAARQAGRTPCRTCKPGSRPSTVP